MKDAWVKYVEHETPGIKSYFCTTLTKSPMIKKLVLGFFSKQKVKSEMMGYYINSKKSTEEVKPPLVRKKQEVLELLMWWCLSSRAQKKNSFEKHQGCNSILQVQDYHLK